MVTVIRHVVLLKLTDPSDAEECVARLEALEGRAEGLVTMTAGADVLRTEASYDVAIIATHPDLAGLRAYADDPVHGEFLAWLRPRLAGRVAVDSEY
ncbi:MAG: hypothetical protein JWO27_3017 [Frankiales bacterium]|jgi:hypothetical protein|nr:hypothetical protein [Frankiales bacterium]